MHVTYDRAGLATCQNELKPDPLPLTYATRHRVPFTVLFRTSIIYLVIYCTRVMTDSLCVGVCTPRNFARIHPALFGNGRERGVVALVGVLYDLAREIYVKLGRTCLLVIRCCIQWLRN